MPDLYHHNFKSIGVDYSQMTDNLPGPLKIQFYNIFIEIIILYFLIATLNYNNLVLT